MRRVTSWVDGSKTGIFGVFEALFGGDFVVGDVGKLVMLDILVLRRCE